MPSLNWVAPRNTAAKAGSRYGAPGFSEVGLWGIEPRELASCFPEMREALERCKFPDCTHRTEPGCAVTAKVAAGGIARERYESYLVLLEELRSAPKDWE